MKNKIKILNWIKGHYFYNKENVSRYYLDLEIIYYNRISFIFHIKLILWFLGLFSGISFYFFYYNDIKMFSKFIKFIKIIFIKYDINLNEQYIYDYINIIDNIIHNKLLILMLMILIIFIIFFFNYNLKIAKEITLIFIYRRINYILNLFLFLNIFDFDIELYVEYNFFYLIIIIIFILKDIIKSIYYKKLCLDSFFCHFLSIPYFLLILSLILLLIQSIYFYRIFFYVIKLNKKFFVVSNHREID